MFVLGITGPTSLVVISIIALIIFGPKNYHNLAEQLVVLWKNLNPQRENIDTDESHDTPSKESKQQREHIK